MSVGTEQKVSPAMMVNTMETKKASPGNGIIPGMVVAAARTTGMNLDVEAVMTARSVCQSSTIGREL